MPRAVLLISLATAAFFAVSFGLTFVARSYVISCARDYVIIRTERYATKAVDVADRGLRVPGARRLMGEEQARRVEEEIAEYREGPRAYIERLVAAKPSLKFRPMAATTPSAASPRWTRARAVAGVLKDQISAYADRTFRRLIVDLRIFTGTNVVASLVAAAMAVRWRRSPDADGTPSDDPLAEERNAYLAWVAALLLASVAFNSYQYVNHLNYFNILLNSYVGWWYPVFVGLTFLRLWWKYGRR